MAFSLNLPYPVCLFLTRLARSFATKARHQSPYSPEAYFDSQYNSSDASRLKFMRQIPLEDKIVLDIGSGLGGRAPYWLEQGARRVINIDINKDELSAGRNLVNRKFPLFASRIDYLLPHELSEKNFADVAILFDCFEHLADPLSVLQQAHNWMKSGSVLWIGSLGWYHYYASHCLGHIPIPWCQVLFSERAIIQTIQTIMRDRDYIKNFWEQTEGIARWDDVVSLKDRPGEPLNMLSLREVQQVLHMSPFSVDQFKVHGFSGKTHPSARLLSFLSYIPFVNEVSHSYYTAVLSKES